MNSQDVINILNTIAEQIGVAVDYVVPALVRYNIAQCLVSLSHSVMSFVVIFIIYKFSSIKLAPIAKEEVAKDEDPVVSVILLFILCGCCALIVFGVLDFYEFTKIIPWLIAPEGSVVNYVLSMIK